MVTCQAPHQLCKGGSFCSYRFFKRVSPCFRLFPLLLNPAANKAQSSHISFSFQLPASFCMTSHGPRINRLHGPVVHIQLNHPTLTSSGPTYSSQQCSPALVLSIHAASFSLGAVGKEKAKPHRVLHGRAQLSACTSSVLSQKKGEGCTINPGVLRAHVTAASCARKGTERSASFITLWFGQTQVYCHTGIKSTALTEMFHQTQHPRQMWRQYW